MNPEQVVTFGVSPQLNGYKPEQIRQLAVRITDELAALPGASAVTGGLVPVLAGSNWGSNVSVEGFDAGPDTDTNSRYNEVLPAISPRLAFRCWPAAKSPRQMASARRRWRW